MKRKRLTGWKRMAAFAMALTLTVGDWTSVGAAGLPQTDVQTVTEAVIQEEDAMEAALATEQPFFREAALVIHGVFSFLWLDTVTAAVGWENHKRDIGF